MIDRALMHRVAEITMTDFIERLARALTELGKRRTSQPAKVSGYVAELRGDLP